MEGEAGNTCLSIVADAVITAVISKCVAFKILPQKVNLAHNTLIVLPSCVYEIEEKYAAELAKALYICHARDSSSSNETISRRESKALPSPCPSGAMAISQMEEYGCLSKNSFSFLFPILNSALTGARTSPGCERALHVLDLHTDEIK